MTNIALTLYCISLLAQVMAAVLAVSLIKFAGRYRMAWFLLAIGFTLMVGRRISPIVYIYDGHLPNIQDAILSLPISIFLFSGVYLLRQYLMKMIDLQSALRKASQRDPLTNTLNKIEVIARAAHEIEKSYQSKSKLAFLILDIDNFKRVNDRYGHLAGDCVLKALAQCCKDSLRTIDILGRVGGEEFLIVLPEIDQKQAMLIAERIRVAIKDLIIYIDSEVMIQITVSIGVAIFDSNLEIKDCHVNQAEKYFSRSDAAMYEAKKLGRNQVFLWEPRLGR